MATLHVRNVPDELYEELRALAERDGRSIGAQAITLLRAALHQRGKLADLLGENLVRPRSPFLQRFSESADEIVVRARGHARELGATEVTPAHVLLAMLEDEVLRHSLERRGITEESVRAVTAPGERTSGAIPVSTEARQLLERVLVASLQG